MKNFIKDGKTLVYANASGSTITSGTPVVVGSIVGIAQGDILDGDTGVIVTEGVFELKVKGGVTPTLGATMYWNATDGLTLTDSDTPIGTVNELVSGNAVARIKIFENAPSASSIAADVAAFGSTTNIPGAACAGGATPTATNVNSAIDTVTAVVETRLDNIETKINAILTALKNANLMA